MKISLCLILKNEGKTVSKAIESVLPIIDNAIIGIDEKTTDDTHDKVVNALQSIPFEIETFQFKNNFSDIRNRFIEKCEDSNYVLILDGHEYLDPTSLEYLKEFKRQDKCLHDIYDFTVIEKNSRNGSYQFQQPRLFKPHIRYENAVHNVITQMESHVAMPQVKLYHDQPFDRLKARKKQRKNMNINGLKEKADSGDARSMFYLAQTYFELEDYNKAAKLYSDYLLTAEFQAERYTANIQLYYCFKRLGKPNCESFLYDCFKEDCANNEHLTLLGDEFFENDDIGRAIHFYRLAAAVPLPQRFLAVEEASYTWMPYFKLAQCYLKLNAVDEVLESIRKGKTYDPQNEYFDLIEKRVKQVLDNNNKVRQGRIYIACSIYSFIKEIVTELQGKFSIKLEQKFNPRKASEADVIFCEWADHNAIAVSHFETDAQKILRVHSYEVYNEHFRNQIDWKAFDKIIFVADHVAQYLINALGSDSEEALHIAKVGETIHNWVDFDRFSIPDEKENNNKIAYAGHFNETKGIRLMLQVARELPHYEFHLAGKWQQEDLKRFALESKPKNVFFYDWQENLNQFFADKSYFLSTSLREGCPVALIEAMSAGLKPLIYNWIGSKELFDEKYIWSTLEELKRVLTFDWLPGDYRSFVKLKFGKENLNKIIEIVSTLINEKKDERESSEILQSIPR